MKKLFLLIYVCILLFIFNKYAYEILNTNASLRTLVFNGKLNTREFDKKGLPISYSPRVGKFISPFYVVHYGLIYSDYILDDNIKNGYHWKKDPSIEYWDVHPEKLSKNEAISNFNSIINWLVMNINYESSKAHFIYNFDWPYKNYPNGKLTKGWWSGLTDGYAIILFLRAYDYYKDEKYLHIAKDLYNSILSDVNNGGSLVYLNGYPWIEEYVDPSLEKEEEMAFVLNGMIYSMYGVKAYEDFFKTKNKKFPVLYQSLIHNLNKFDKDGWSYYDLISNEANIKYHAIHVSLVKDLYRNFKNDIFKEFSNKWEPKLKNIGFNYVFYGPISVSWYQFILSFFLLLIIPYLILYRFANEK